MFGTLPLENIKRKLPEKVAFFMSVGRLKAYPTIAKKSASSHKL
jgi:hypothetical protein